MENNINVRGLSTWEFLLLKEIIENQITFKVRLKHNKEKYLGGAVTIKPTKNERYYWNKDQFEELRALLDSLGADYNRIGVPENMVHSVFSNGFSYLKFKADETNRLSFPGIVPNICVKHARFDTRFTAERFVEKNSVRLGVELLIGLHPKDGFVVYSPSYNQLKKGDWTTINKTDTHKGDIWSKGVLGYHYRCQTLISGFTPVNGIDEDGIEYLFDGIMVYSYHRATGTELLEEREFLPWNGEETRNVHIPHTLFAAAEALIAESPPMMLETALR